MPSFSQFNNSFIMNVWRLITLLNEYHLFYLGPSKTPTEMQPINTNI